MDDSFAAQSFEDGHEAWDGIGWDGALGDQLVGDLTQRTPAAGFDEGKQAAIDEQELPVPVAVRQGAEALRSQGHRVVQADVVGSLHRRCVMSCRGEACLALV